MSEPFKRGDRVEWKDFGEGTIVGLTETGHLKVAFSETETFELTWDELEKAQ
ncbi:hypothetical protein [Effusibacillus consociatus]|uniref:DUF3553 domain-containing protein n=1 Tax=Effusibacillus consociatus TaxID=1117041 RepID=A0ABV9PXK3_9BACL